MIGSRSHQNSDKRRNAYVSLYQIDPREAVPEVSKGKGYINQEKMCL